MNDLRIKNSLIKIRKMHNLTQAQFAEKIGVSDKTVSKWECGNSIPDIIMLNQISKIFNVPINDIIVGNINNSYPKKIFSKKKIFIISILVLILICLIFLLVKIGDGKNNIKPKDDPYKDEYSCTYKTTYHIENIYESNDENYLYYTVTQFQTEGVFVIRLPKSIAQNIEINNDYIFTLRTNIEYIYKLTNILFENSTVINIEKTDLTGLEQVNRFYCD